MSSFYFGDGQKEGKAKQMQEDQDHGTHLPSALSLRNRCHFLIWRGFGDHPNNFFGRSRFRLGDCVMFKRARPENDRVQ
jgi:hypothetical protein